MDNMREEDLTRLARERSQLLGFARLAWKRYHMVDSAEVDAEGWPIRVMAAEIPAQEIDDYFLCVLSDELREEIASP